MAEERRIVTVLFADVVGSTTLAQELDPEDLRALLARFYAVASDVIAARGGTLEKFIADPARGERLPVRVGVSTGGVVATRDLTAGDFLVTGDPVNTAARLQQAAEPWTVLCGERTAQAAEWRFAFGPVQIVHADAATFAADVIANFPIARIRLELVERALRPCTDNLVPAPADRLAPIIVAASLQGSRVLEAQGRAVVSMDQAAPADVGFRPFLSKSPASDASTGLLNKYP